MQSNYRFALMSDSGERKPLIKSKRSRGRASRGWNVPETLGVMSFVMSLALVGIVIWYGIWNGNQSNEVGNLEDKSGVLMMNVTELLAIIEQQQQEIEALQENVTALADIPIPEVDPTTFQQVQLSTMFNLVAAGASNTFYDIPMMELILQPGRYWMGYNMHVSIAGSTTAVIQMRIVDSDTTNICPGSIGLSSSGQTSDITRNAYLDTNTTMTLRVQARRSNTASTAIVVDVSLTSSLADPDVSSVFWAIKLP